MGASGALGQSWQQAPGPCLPRTAACRHMRPGQPGQGVGASRQAVSHIAAPLSLDTCWYCPPARAGRAGPPEDPPRARGPTAQPHLVHQPSGASSWLGLAQRGAGDRSQLQLRGSQEAVGSGPGWAAGRGGAVQSRPGVRGQSRARMEDRGAIWAFHPPPVAQGHGDPELHRAGNQPSRNLPNLAPSAE